MEKWLNILGEAVFPSNISCIGCMQSISKQNPYSLCHSCYKNIVFTDSVCRHCGRRTVEEGYCYCTDERYYYDTVSTVMAYNSFSQKLVYRYKYGQKTYLAEFFAELLEEKIRREGMSYDYLTYVPIHPARIKTRGFHQVELMAEMLGERLELPVIDMVIRRKNTPFLSEKKPFERMLILEEAFEPKEIVLKENSLILLLDDIITSGATLSLTAKAIKKRIPDATVDAMAVCNART